MGRRDWRESSSSRFSHVRRLRAFRPLNNFELYRISFLQSPVTFAVDCCVMDKNVRTIIASYETVSLGIIEPLDSTLH